MIETYNISQFEKYLYTLADFKIFRGGEDILLSLKPCLAASWNVA